MAVVVDDVAGGAGSIMRQFKRLRGDKEKGTFRFEVGILDAIRKLAAEERASESWMISQLLREALAARGIQIVQENQEQQ